MRAAVKKPTAHAIRVQTTVEVKAPELRHVLTPKSTASTIDPSRSERAVEIPRSEKISRFGGAESKNGSATTISHVPVHVVPEPPEDNEPTAPEPKRTNTPDMFVQAIANASHFVDIKEHHAKQRRAAKRHAISMATGFAALLLIAGFATYINTPGLQIKVAGIQAGVTAIQPDFEKAGFAYNGVRANDGKRVIGLQSNGHQYQLLERSTNWDGQTMIHTVSSVSANGTPNYTPIKVGSHTIYRFNEKQATWVKNGTWYHLSGDAAVSDAQLSALVQNS